MPVNQDSSGLLDRLFWEPNLLDLGIAPSGSVKLNPNHHLAAHVKAIFKMENGRFVDVLNRQLPSANSATTRVSKQGIKADYNNQQTAFANKPNYRLTGELSIVAFVDVDALSNYSALISCADTSTTNGWELRLGSGPSDSKILMHRANADFVQFESASDQITAGTKDNCIGLSCGDQIESVPDCWVNGATVTLADTGGGLGTGTQSAPSDPLYIGKREDAVTYLDGAAQLLYLFDKKITKNDYNEIREDRWALTEPESPDYLTSIAAAAPPTGFQAAWARNSNQIIGVSQ